MALSTYWSTVLTDPHPAGYLEKLNMDVKDYDQNFNRDPSNLLAKIDLANPERIVVEDKSIHQLMRQYMSAQSDTSSRLIDFIGQRITNEVEIDGRKLSVVDQQRELSEIANKSTLLSRQMEKLLDERNKLQKGVDYVKGAPDVHLWTGGQSLGHGSPDDR